MRLAVLLLVVCSCAAQRAALVGPGVPTLRERSALMPSAKGDIRDVYRKVAPATVVVRARHGYGTGVIIDARGFILTNHHVIADSESVDFKRRVHVELGTLNAQGYMEKQPRSHVAWVLKSDPALDLAVLRLDDPPKELPSIEVSPTDPVPGEPVAALGHGGIGLLWAIRDGEVSSIGKLATQLARLAAADADCGADQECLLTRSEAERARVQLANRVPALVIQSSCQISPGDSGGPLVNRSGQLVGVNAFLQSDPGVPVATNFHVHVSEVRGFLEKVPAEPEPRAPSPYELARGGTPQQLDTDGDGVKETTTYALAASWVVFSQLAPGTSIAVGRLDGHTAVWSTERLAIEAAMGSGRGAAWQTPAGAAPQKLGDDLPLFERAKLSPEAAKRFDVVERDVLGPLGLALNQPLDQAPDPYASQRWQLFDFDGDGKPECGLSVTAAVMDPKQRLAEPIASAPIAVMRLDRRGWVVVNGQAYATEDFDSGAVTVGPARGQLAAATALAGLDEAERKRARFSLRKLAPRQLTEGGAWPNPVADVGADVIAEQSGVKGLEHAVVSVVGDKNASLVFELDRDSVGSAGEMERRAKKGQGADMAWVRRSQTEWFLYDTDHDGAFDVMLFKGPSGPIEGFRRDGKGGIARAPELDGPKAVRPGLLGDAKQREAFAALAKVFFNAEVVEQ